VSEQIEITIDEVRPDKMSVLKLQGFKPGTKTNPRVMDILDRAQAVFEKITAPAGIIHEISSEEFETVYQGEGSNDPETPLEGIYPRADHLALFAVTVGAEVSSRIRELFIARDFAVASLLDSVASEAADRAAAVAEIRFAERLRERGAFPAGSRALRYSPGYCGWHVTGQRALFARLQPEQIGITLRESCLMEPLKSVSGVVVCGSEEIHEFDPGFPFCSACKTHSCTARMRAQQER
jgi:hypothetical protein